MLGQTVSAEKLMVEKGRVVYSSINMVEPYTKYTHTQFTECTAKTGLEPLQIRYTNGIQHHRIMIIVVTMCNGVYVVHWQMAGH